MCDLADRQAITQLHSAHFRVHRHGVHLFSPPPKTRQVRSKHPGQFSLRRTTLSWSIFNARQQPWAFFCLTEGAFEAPRWVLLPGYAAKPIHDIAEIAHELRSRLGPGVEDIQDFESGATELEQFINRLGSIERGLLSQKKQRALEELDYCLGRLEEKASAEGRQPSLDFCLRLRTRLSRPRLEQQPDWEVVASRWLDLIRPIWFEKLSGSRRTRPLLLKDLRKDLLARSNWLECEIVQQFGEIPLLPGIDRRIRACIVAVAVQ